MAVRYIFRTSGEFAAFAEGDNLFGPDSQWLGFIRSGNEVYSKQGTFIGYLTDDDRIVRNSTEQPRLPLWPPFPPFTPFPPFPPLPRLPMPPLPYPYEDVFEVGVLLPRGPVFKAELRKYDNLEGAELIAADRTFLGLVSRNRYDPRSISNQYGQYGSRYSPTSIMNPYGPYGSRFGLLSPFNKFSIQPPQLIKQGKSMGALSVNQFAPNRIDPSEFLLWLGVGADQAGAL